MRVIQILPLSAMLPFMVAGLGCESIARVAEREPITEAPAEGGASDEHELEFLVLGMSCENCSRSATEALKKGIPELGGVTVDFATKQGRVLGRGSVSRAQIREALGNLGFEAQFSEDPPRPSPLPETEKIKLDIETVSRGEAIRIEDHLVPGKYTIFDYFADWCGPCHLLTPKLERLVQDNDRVALRVLDISNWESAAAKQATRDFKLPGLPYVRVYGPDGGFRGAVHGNQVEKVHALIRSRRQN